MFKHTTESDFPFSLSWRDLLAFLIIFIALLCITGTIGCSPVSYQTKQSIPYCRYQNTVWYRAELDNCLNEYIFYKDSVIIWQYTYSPYKQKQGNITLEQYEVTDVLKRKLDILDKDIPYEDGDDQLLLLQYYKGYSVTDAGAKIYDWSTYSYIYVSYLSDTVMYMGMYSEFFDVQVPWEFRSTPQLKLIFK